VVKIGRSSNVQNFGKRSCQRKKRKKKSHLELILTPDECSSQNERPNEKCWMKFYKHLTHHWLVGNNTW
jgi:hypothetical protein